MDLNNPRFMRTKINVPSGQDVSLEVKEVGFGEFIELMGMSIEEREDKVMEELAKKGIEEMAYINGPVTISSIPQTDVLAERGKRYGEFKINADIAQELKNEMHSRSGWVDLKPFQQEALDQIASKISRILGGDSNYKDNWTDISGYARLVEERL